MNKKYNVLISILPLLLDILIIYIGFVLAYWFRFLTGIIPTPKGIPPIAPYLSFSSVVIVVWILILSFSGIYETNKFYSMLDESYEVLKGIFIGTIVILAPTFFYRNFTFSRIVILLACFLSCFLLMLGKTMIRILKRKMFKEGIGVKNACIVGKGRDVESVIAKFRENPVTGYKLIGQIIDEKTEPLPGLPVLGNLVQIKETIEKEKIDTLLITTPLSHHNEIAKLLLRCEALPVELRFIPDPYELLTSKIGYYEIEGLTLLGLREFPLTYWNAFLKRSFDLLVSLFLFILLLPVGIIVALVVKCSSRGPVFYSQPRIGKGGKIFNIVKFRSMIVNAEKDTGAVFASSSDPRVTKVGKFIRRLGIDEFPQLINIIKGEMSLVGPRPERPEFVEKFSEEIIRYLERHKVAPGVTGWAQVNGLRGNSSIKERIKYDLYYIENWSINFDIKIILRTLAATIKGKNAY